MIKMGISDKKKIICIAAALLLIAVLIVSGVLLVRANREKEPSLSEIVSDKLNAYQTDLADSLETLNTNEKVADYLMSWASNKNIKASRDEANNVIFSLKASSKELSGGKPTIIACEYDASDMLSYIEPMATALTVAKNSKNHGDFKLLFMPSESGRMYGASAVSASYLTDGTELFYLGKSSSSKVSLTTGGYEELEISAKLDRSSPTHDKAYKISIDGVPAQTIGGKYKSAPNPIKQLGSLLASFKSSSFLFELSSFSGGSGVNVTPAEAKMTIVINSADDEKFISKMDKAIEKFYDKYSEDFPDISYTYEETKLPKKVFVKTETENIISLLYTSPNGVYYKDDDGNIAALTNIGKISTKNAKLDIRLCAMSSSYELLDELHDSYRTIAGLCSANIHTREHYDIFSGGGACAALLNSFETAFLSYTEDSKMIVEPAFETNACNVLYERNPNIAMIYCAITEKTKEKFAGSLISYLDGGEALA